VIYYVSLDLKMRSVEVSTDESTLNVGQAQTLFQLPRSVERSYDVTSDGKRFLILRGLASESESPLSLVVNWPAELTKK
jgi:hypothetical protein